MYTVQAEQPVTTLQYLAIRYVERMHVETSQDWNTTTQCVQVTTK